MKFPAKSSDYATTHSSLKWLAPLAIFMALVFGGCWYIMRGRYLRCIVDRHVRLGFENPGVSLDVVEVPCDWRTVKPCISPAPTEVRVITPTSVFMMNSAKDLRGLVTIHDSREALRFARLDTRLDLLYAMPSNTLEVISHSQAGRPEFADTGGQYGTGNHSGLYGIISDADYAAEGFQPPVVTTQDNTYRIQRWVCTFPDLNGKEIQLWDETVGHDGSYKCAVIQSKPVPKRPGQWWGIFGLM